MFSIPDVSKMFLLYVIEKRLEIFKEKEEM
jgi:hypothetical protein